MPLSSIDRVRSLIGDMNKSAVNEDVSRGDGATTVFQLDMFPVRTGSLTIYVTGVAKPSATSTPTLGTFDLTGSAPAQGDMIVATYQYNTLSDDEIQSTIDTVSGTIGDHILLAASIAARGLAGNYARFFAYTQGDKSVNKDKLADKLISLAESLQEAYTTTITNGNWNMTKATGDSSGTAFDGYDTASSNPPPSDYNQWGQW